MGMKRVFFYLAIIAFFIAYFAQKSEACVFPNSNINNLVGQPNAAVMYNGAPLGDFATGQCFPDLTLARTPDLANAPLRTAQQSGLWEDPNTWGGIIPGPHEIAVIPAGIIVTVDRELDPNTGIPDGAEVVGVHGSLKLKPDVRTAFQAKTLEVFPDGYFEIGTQCNPETAHALLWLGGNQPLDLPGEYDNGLLVFGTI